VAIVAFFIESLPLDCGPVEYRAVRRSFTFSYMLLGDLTIAVAVGILGVSGFLGWMGGLPFVFVALAVICALLLARAHFAYLVRRSAFTLAECIAVTIFGVLVPAVFWLVVAATLSALGADFFDS
jgi:hypothetical protein